MYALESASTGTVLVSELNKLITQYEWQLKSLQAENSMLRNEVSKAGIKIPLTDFQASNDAGSTTTSSGSTSVIVSSGWTTTAVQATTQISVSGEWNAALDKVEKEQWARYRGFIQTITPNWPAIRNAYKLKENATVMGYEFVKKWNDDHVFVDIAYEWAGTGVYDAKILYQYNTGTFARKLIGLFEFNRTTGYYSTKTGNNPFAGVPRTFVAHPKINGVVTSSTSTTTTTSSSASGTTTTTTTTTDTASSVTLADIEKAYGDKRYLSVISLSNTYLASNPATYDLLRIRYRTYFIIGKYTESLAEIEKINGLGRLDKSVACDAQVIATYSKNTTLVNTYTSICKK